ncbi:MAG TPA: glycosyltransferase N-terminal domain-containing protein [Thermoanaerobaculia bacterium]|nr:glycosyltransferase N-terminal domain-containing protein [Thermoanaerobaculia bacterium]
MTRSDRPSAGGTGLTALLARRLLPEAVPGRVDVWVQGVSVGEVELAHTLALALRSARPELSLLVTSSTPAGVGLLERRFRDLAPPARLQPFPLDLPVSVRRLLDSATPRLLVLMETELWPVLLRAARRRGLPVLVASGRLSERSVRRLRAARPLFRGGLDALSAVAARSEEDAERFAAVGVPRERVHVAGDMKFDRPLPAEPAFAASFRELAAGRPVLVAGSIAEEELDLALSLPRLLARGASGTPFLLLAPRRTESWDEAERRAVAAGLRLVRRSRPAPDGPADVFLLDTLGELASAYTLGDVALLGGTFGRRGGHNVLEPLQAGLPVVLGPSVWNIRRVVEAAGAAVVGVPDPAGVAPALARLLDDPAARAAAREAAAALFATHRGATERTVRLALGFLDGRPGAAA